ncbi:MAG: hypothetical protein IJX85_03855 [Lachnospiraceae bacterium]|nr:hypothetical protein [Lachnospiraceae bacterium]
MDEEIKIIRDIIEAKAKEHNVDLSYFHVGELVCNFEHGGCFKRNGSWFLYQTDDRYMQTTFNGPFTLRGIIYACSLMLRFSKHLEEYDLSDEGFEVCFSHRYYSLEEIDEKCKDMLFMKLLKEKVSDRNFYKIGYCNNIDKYMLVICVPNYAYYDMYYEISEEEFNQYDINPSYLDELVDSIRHNSYRSDRFLFSNLLRDNNEEQEELKKSAMSD